MSMKLLVEYLIEASKRRESIASLEGKNGNAPKYLHEEAQHYEEQALELAEYIDRSQQ